MSAKSLEGLRRTHIYGAAVCLFVCLFNKTTPIWFSFLNEHAVPERVTVIQSCRCERMIGVDSFEVGRVASYYSHFTDEETEVRE